MFQDILNIDPGRYYRVLTWFKFLGVACIAKYEQHATQIVNMLIAQF